ncbi:MAG: phage antirepressor KilAC domain-containing protein [Treponema sp.]|jgi:phage antirepressor YoqD-like protein/DNA-binding CsgD family transcriptional regulator|nr:phage antirepressor KilAC domain-containing protein [Treponema sp.]
MNELARQGDKRMTVKEVAEALGVHYDTVASHVKQLFPELVRNGITTYLDDVQVTAVKLEIQKSHNLRNSPKVHDAKTDLGKKLYTVKDLADKFGCDTHTITNHANRLFPGKIQNGVKTYFDEREVTLILESIKRGQENQTTLKGSLQGTETSLTPTLKVAELAELIERSHREIEAIKDAEIERLKREREADAPKVEFFDQVADSKDALQMRDVAGVLNLSGYGRNTLFEFLRKKEVLDSRNIPYRKFQDQGYFRVIEQKWTDNEGETHISLKTLAYQRGVDFIRKLIQKAKS